MNMTALVTKIISEHEEGQVEVIVLPELCRIVAKYLEADGATVRMFEFGQDDNYVVSLYEFLRWTTNEGLLSVQS
jgi:hypothetical protein